MEELCLRGGAEDIACHFYIFFLVRVSAKREGL